MGKKGRKVSNACSDAIDSFCDAIGQRFAGRTTRAAQLAIFGTDAGRDKRPLVTPGHIVEVARIGQMSGKQTEPLTTLKRIRHTLTSGSSIADVDAWLKDDGNPAVEAVLAVIRPVIEELEDKTDAAPSAPPRPSGRAAKPRPAYDADADKAVALWDETNPLIDDILDVVWFLYRHPQFIEWSDDTAETRGDDKAMPSIIARLIFGEGGEDQEYWNRFKAGIVPPGVVRTGPLSASYGLRGFFNKQLSDKTGYKCRELFGDDAALMEEKVVLFQDLFDSDAGLADTMHRVRSGTALSAAQIKAEYVKRKGKGEIGGNNPDAQPLDESQFIPDLEESRRFLRGGAVNFRHVKEGTATRPEFQDVLQLVADGKQFILVHAPIAAGRTTLLKQLAHHFMSQDKTVWFAGSRDSFADAMDSAVRIGKPSQGVVIFDDAYEPTNKVQDTNYPRRLRNWINAAPDARALLIMSVQTRFLEAAKTTLLFHVPDVDQSQYEKRRCIIELKSRPRWQDVEALLLGFGALDNGKSADEAERDFVRYAGRSYWDACYAATHAGGLKESFGKLVGEARSNGWLYTLAAIVIANRNASWSPPQDATRYLNQVWREAVDWLLAISPGNIRPALPGYDSSQENMASLDGILDQMEGEIVRPSGNRRGNLTLRSPLVACVLEEAIFGWSADLGGSASFKANKLDWIIQLSGFVTKPDVAIEARGKLLQDLYLTVSQYLREHKLVCNEDDLLQPHLEPDFPTGKLLPAKFRHYLDSEIFAEFFTKFEARWAQITERLDERIDGEAPKSLPPAEPASPAHQTSG